MFGVRFSARVHAAIASGALTLAGCFSDLGLQGAASGPDSDAAATTTSGDDTATTSSTTAEAPATTGAATTTDGTGEPPATTSGTGGPHSQPGPPELVSVELDGDTLRLTFTEPMGSVLGVEPARFRLSAAIFVPDAGVTRYYDPSAWNEECYDVGPGMSYCYEGPLTVDDVDDAEAEHQLYVELESYVLEATCAELAARAATLNGAGALYLHYRDDGAEGVVDADGEALVGFGESWVTADATLELPGEFPELVPRLPIPCEPY